MTTRILHDAVAGAIRAGKGRDKQGATVRRAAEGTMQVASSLGIPPDEAVSQISRAAVESLNDSEENLIVGGRAAMRGVMEGAATARENVPAAARLSAYELVSNAANFGFKDLGSLAAALAEAAVEARAESWIDAERLARDVARGSLSAAEEVSDSAGDAVRSALTDTLGDVSASSDTDNTGSA